MEWWETRDTRDMRCDRCGRRARDHFLETFCGVAYVGLHRAS